nr:tetratricopeptide repeat protein [Micromonospora sp. DSM 115978]
MGSALRRFRERALLTQEELAARSGLSARTIRRIESGVLKRPRAESIRLLVDALGLTPQEHRDLLRPEPAGRHGPADSADPPAPAGPTPRGTLTAPRQLPAAPVLFVGRTSALRRLDLLLDADTRPASTVVVSAIAGTAGVGKTSLALHWAHRAADRFPDGQFYVNLHGFDASDTMVRPADALRGFLDALDVPAQRIPAGQDERAGLYRSLMAGRRMLVLLDNARDAEQVRPLLPGTPDCLVVVTSRNQLPGLVATEGAQPLTLDLLTPDEARELLARRIGAARVAAEPAAVDEIVAHCAGLPLALAIVAARSVTDPGRALADLAAELRDSGAGLDGFATGDPATDVRLVFSWSYRCLNPPAARLFRLVGLHPGPDLAGPAAASLAAEPESVVRPLLAELVRAHLITEHTPGRYASHDLLRAYATELVHRDDAEPERRSALGRLFDHYLHTADAAARLLHPYRDGVDLELPAAGAVVEKIETTAYAMDWFAAEHPALMAAIRQAAGTGFDPMAWRLAWALWEFLDRRGHWHDWADSQRTALAAARRSADPRGQAHAHRSLGLAQLQLGHHDEAETHLRAALDLYRAVGDEIGQARIHHNLCGVREQQGRLPDALDHALRALHLFRSSGHRQGLANALNAVGWFQIQTGDARAAVDHCREAIDLLEALGDRRGQANTWDSLGYAQHHLGDHPGAVASYRRAIDLYQELGDRYFLADTLGHLAETHLAAGDRGAARDTWRRSLEILDDLGHPDAAAVRTRLRTTPAT